MWRITKANDMTVNHNLRSNEMEECTNEKVFAYTLFLLLDCIITFYIVGASSISTNGGRIVSTHCQNTVYYAYLTYCLPLSLSYFKVFYVKWFLWFEMCDNHGLTSLDSFFLYSKSTFQMNTTINADNKRIFLFKKKDGSYLSWAY